jgi:hypothetical protein
LIEKGGGRREEGSREKEREGKRGMLDTVMGVVILYSVYTGVCCFAASSTLIYVCLYTMID